MTPIEQILNQVDWQPIEHDAEQKSGLYATHEGVMKVGDIEMKVYVLNDGQRIIPEDEIEKFFDCGIKNWLL